MRNTGSLKVTTPTEREVVLTRVFDAPRHLVYGALTKPELLKRWFGPRGWSLKVCEVDLRGGGAWRFVLHGPDGTDMGMSGVGRAPGSDRERGALRSESRVRAKADGRGDLK